jgi:hypothetical protein
MISWKQLRWVVTASLVSGLAGAILMAHLQAGPLDVPLQYKTNTSSQPVLHSAEFQHGSFYTYTLRSEPGNDESKPIVFLFGELRTEYIMPSENVPTGTKQFTYMYVTEDLLKKFPSAREMVEIEQGIVANPIDTTYAEHGLEQLKAAYAKARGSD